MSYSVLDAGNASGSGSVVVTNTATSGQKTGAVHQCVAIDAEKGLRPPSEGAGPDGTDSHRLGGCRSQLVPEPDVHRLSESLPHLVKRYGRGRLDPGRHHGAFAARGDRVRPRIAPDSQERGGRPVPRTLRRRHARGARGVDDPRCRFDTWQRGDLLPQRPLGHEPLVHEFDHRASSLPLLCRPDVRLRDEVARNRQAERTTTRTSSARSSARPRPPVRSSCRGNRLSERSRASSRVYTPASAPTSGSGDVRVCGILGALRGARALFRRHRRSLRPGSDARTRVTVRRGAVRNAVRLQPQRHLHASATALNGAVLDRTPVSGVGTEEPTSASVTSPTRSRERTSRPGHGTRRTSTWSSRPRPRSSRT